MTRNKLGQFAARAKEGIYEIVFLCSFTMICMAVILAAMDMRGLI